MRLKLGGSDFLPRLLPAKRVHSFLEHRRAQQAAQLVQDQYALAGGDAIPIALDQIGVNLGQLNLAAGARACQVAAAVTVELRRQAITIFGTELALSAVLFPFLAEGMFAGDHPL